MTKVMTKVFGAVFSLAVLAPTAFAVPMCYTGQVVWQGGPSPVAGCIFTTWGSAQQSMCGGATNIMPTNNGTCYVCVISNQVTNVQTGNWSGLTVGVNQVGATPADFSCLQCISPFTGTVGWWALDETTLGTAADLSGMGNDGTHVNNPVPVTGLVRGGLQINSTNGYVDIPDAPSLNFGTGNFSIHAWVKLNASNAVSVIVDKRSQGPFKGYHLFLYNGKLGLQLADGIGAGYSNYVATNPAVPVDNNWHHIAVTVNRASTTGIKFYLDGAQAGTPFNPTGRSGSLNNSSPLRIGVRSTDGTGVFKGSIDEVTMLNQLLTPVQIQALYNVRFWGQCK